ncbi:DUF998 domain-containing protein [Prauserella muralis]|uniref:Uncharacterized protein n=1 Tax=Prauserella muralis TaxID=588067 RepID=A0A2V4BAX0_9PSEU|nr:DUF998 domain-containing protein [Prauserella muralis]PXY32438.1 hypothetical protein BAY60_09255 [Prauserella muralis]TWE23869.1 uncharacterized protein DUF998 [Prauserella muralis]
MTASGVSERRARWVGGFSVLACVLSVLALLTLVRSALTMTYLNVHFADEIDPLSRAVSYYVFVERGAELFDAALLAVACATATILAGLAQLRVRVGARATVLFGAWCVALVLCVLFPTDNSPRIETASGWIHQFAGASLFGTLPLAGLALARVLATQPPWARTARVLRALALGAVVLALGYLAARLPDLLPWWQFPGALDWRAISGLIQRALFTLELAMLLVLAARLLRVSWAAVRSGRQRDHTLAAP